MTNDFTPNESMILSDQDMKSIDFFDLDDIVEFNEEGGAMPKGSDEGVMKGNKPSTEEPEFNFEDIDKDEGDESEVDDLIDSRDEVDADYSNINPSEFLSTLPDDAVLDIGGGQFTKAQLRELASTNQEVTTKNEAVSRYVEQFTNIDRKVDAAFAAAITETEMTYEAVQNKLNDPRTTDSERGRLYNDIRNLQARYTRIQEGVAQVERARQERENVDLGRRYEEVNTVMGRELGSQWNPEYARSVIDYALSNGVSKEQITKGLSANFFKLMVKAKKFDEGEKKRTEKLNETMTSRAPRSKRSSNAPRGTNNDNLSVSKRKAIEGFNKGTMTEKDLSNVFGLLED